MVTMRGGVWHNFTELFVNSASAHIISRGCKESYSESCSESYSNVIFSIICKKRVSSNSFWRFPSITGNDWRAAHRPLWMAAITVPWPFRSHTNKEIYDLVQCAIKVHVVIPSTFTARSGYAALLLQVYSLLVEKQLLVFLGGKQEKAEVVRECGWEKQVG